MPFLGIWAIVFARVLRGGKWRAVERSDDCRFLFNIVLASLALLVVLALATGYRLQGRYMFPYLLFIPILCFALVFRKLQLGAIDARWLQTRVKVYATIVASLVTIVIVALAIWALRPPPDCGRCRLQKPYPGLARLLAERGITGGTLIAKDEFIGGNLRAHIPGLRTYSLAYPGYVPPARPRRSPTLCLLVWDAAGGDSVPSSLVATASAIRGNDWPENIEVMGVAIPFPVKSETTYMWRYAVLPPAGDCY
jgi:hypothetical protein